MNSYLTDEFIECFRDLPDSVKEQARKSYRLWRDNPRHPSLHFKRIHSTQSIYSVRISLGWRALGLVEGENIYWYWIGPHAEYERLIK